MCIRGPKDGGIVKSVITVAISYSEIKQVALYSNRKVKMTTPIKTAPEDPAPKGGVE